MKFRQHRGGLAESMATTVEVSDAPEIIAIVGLSGRLTSKHAGFDDRTGWDTHVVSLDGRAVGMTDAALAD